MPRGCIVKKIAGTEVDDARHNHLPTPAASCPQHGGRPAGQAAVDQVELRVADAMLGGAYEFSILGPIEVVTADGPLKMSGPKERAVLAVLVAWAGRVVSAERLTEAVWGDDPPRSSGKVVQNLVLRLRKALGPDVIETRPG